MTCKLCQANKIPLKLCQSSVLNDLDAVSRRRSQAFPHYYCVDYNGVVRNNWAGLGVGGNHRTMPQVTGDPRGQLGFFFFFPLTLSEFS